MLWLLNGQIAINIVKGNLKNLGAYVAHIGIAIFILGVIGSMGFGDQVNVDLVKDKPVTAFGYEMTFTGYTPIENNTKYAFNINLKKGNSTYTVSPIMYMSEFNNSLMREPAILNLFSKDIYLAPLGYDEGTDQNNSNGETVKLEKGVETEYNGSKISFDHFDVSSETMTAMQAGKDFQMGAVFNN